MITFMNNNVLIRDKVVKRWKSLWKAKGSHFPIDKKKIRMIDARMNGRSMPKNLVVFVARMLDSWIDKW